MSSANYLVSSHSYKSTSGESGQHFKETKEPMAPVAAPAAAPRQPWHQTELVESKFARDPEP